MSSALPIPPYGPMRLGQILDRVFRLLRANSRSLIGIALVPGLTMFIIYAAAFVALGPSFISAIRGEKPEPTFHLIAISSAIFFPIMLVYLLVFAVYLAAASYAAVLADCSVRVTFGEAYRVAWSRAGHYVLLALSIYAITFLPALLLEIPVIVSTTLMGANKTLNPIMIVFFPFLFFLVFAAFVAGALVALRLSLAFSASVFESLKVKEAIKRSWALTRGALGRIFLVALVIYAAIYIATMVLMFGTIFLGAVGFFILGPHDRLSAHAITALVVCAISVYLALMGLITMITWASFTTTFGVIYNDQRLRIEESPVAKPLSRVPE